MSKHMPQVSKLQNTFSGYKETCNHENYSQKKPAIPQKRDLSNKASHVNHLLLVRTLSFPGRVNKVDVAESVGLC